MNVIGMTVFVGLVLVGLFVYLFWHQARGPGGAGDDRDALMPLEEDDGVTPADRGGPAH
jgi:hypothetical protein